MTRLWTVTTRLTDRGTRVAVRAGGNCREPLRQPGQIGFRPTIDRLTQRKRTVFAGE